MTKKELIESMSNADDNAIISFWDEEEEDQYEIMHVESTAERVILGQYAHEE